MLKLKLAKALLYTKIGEFASVLPNKIIKLKKKRNGAGKNLILLCTAPDGRCSDFYGSERDAFSPEPLETPSLETVKSYFVTLAASAMPDQF